MLKITIGRPRMLETAFVSAAVVLVIQLNWAAIGNSLQRPREGRQIARTMKTPTPTMGKYLVYVPASYDSSRKWPLVVYLHGSGSRGDDLARIAREGPPRLAAEGRHLPYVLASPQCRAKMSWAPEDVMALIDEVSRELAIDPGRIYLTGFSMGGYGAWETACAFPERFAAIAPVAGGGDPSQAERLRDVAVWAFHGADDKVVPLSASQEMVNAARQAEALVNFTVFPQAGHGVCNRAYATTKFWTWLLCQRRSSRSGFTSPFPSFRGVYASRTP